MRILCILYPATTVECSNFFLLFAAAVVSLVQIKNVKQYCTVSKNVIVCKSYSGSSSFFFFSKTCNGQRKVNAVWLFLSHCTGGFLITKEADLYVVRSFFMELQYLRHREFRC